MMRVFKVKKESYSDGQQFFNGRPYFNLDQRMDEYMVGCLRNNLSLSLVELQEIVRRKFGRPSKGLTAKSLLVLKEQAVKDKESLGSVREIW